MQKHFNLEMRHLNNALLDYSEQHPEEARTLNLTEKTYKDPAITRLLEGVAFMGAQIKQHLERDIPEISELLLQQVASDFLSPIVATSVLKVSVDDKTKAQALPKRQKVKGLVDAPDIKQYCTFETKSHLTVYPFKIEDIQFSQLIQKRCTHIDITLNYAGDDPLPDALPIYIHAEHDLAYRIYTLLCHHVTSGLVWSNEHPSYTLSVTGLSTLLNQESLPMLSQLKTFFTAPEQFFYIYIHGLQQLTELGQADQYYIRLTADTIVDEQTMFLPHNLKLNCVNIENAFQMSSEPVECDDARYEHEVVIDNNYPDFYSLMAVNDVRGHQDAIIETFKPVQSLKPQNPEEQHYQVIHRQNTNQQTLSYISFQKPVHHEKSISCDVKVSNNHYPRRYLMRGDIDCLEDNDQLHVHNLHRPTPYCTFDDEGSRTWRCVSFMQMQISSLLELNNLQSYLFMTVWQANRRDLAKKIESIYAIHYDVAYQLHKGIFYPILDVELEINERSFSCVSEVYLWGEWLYALFLDALDVNHLLHFKVSCPGEDVQYHWQQQKGRQYAL